MMTELMTIHEVAEILRVSYETALMYVKQNNLSIKIGRQYRVPKDKLAAHLNRQPSAPIKLTRSR
jgi:excisionase family DNA binding protein